MEGLRTVVLVVLNQIANVGSYTGFALAGKSPGLRGFLLWQIFGSAFGLCVQLSYSGMVRYTTVGLANAFGVGLAFVSIQLFAAYLFFHEPFSTAQWLGSGFVFVGIVLLALGGR